MRIGILGPLEVRDEAGLPVAVNGRRLRGLLVRLAAEAGRPVSAGRLLDDLWDGDAPGGNALQALVSRLRGVAGRDLVEHGPAGYRLAVDPGEVDAVAFERAVAAARRELEPARRAEALRRALGLWRGPVPADVAAGLVSRLEDLRVAAVEERTDAETAAGLPAPPAAELEPFAVAHPLRERLRGQFMRALCAEGRQADALRVYEETRRALADRLGADPSPELAAVHLEILRRDPAPPPPPLPPVPPLPPAPSPPPAPPAPSSPSLPPLPTPPRTNLPAPLTSFVGREDESRRVGGLLGETRLVTLTGPGGAGKTRLAAETAAALVEDTPDGVWFVPLAPVSDPGHVVQALLSALDVPEIVRETRAGRPIDRLTDFLAARRTIIVLDNCEHVIDAVAGLADHVLARAPGVRILATSREPLGITGESLCPVPSLALPPPGEDGAGAARYASVRLFADRAAAVRPGFTVDADAVEICRALDGIPLAIELAAARLRSLTTAQVAARLGDRFRLLTGGSRTALPRHRTLRAVVDWSWELLDDTERAVLRRLSVFAGGATPEAALRVCGQDDLDVIAALIDKSLVMAEGDPDVRYRLLETVRVYAAERLEEAGEAENVRAEHAACQLELAERAEPELRRRDQLRWAARLNAERDNHAAAFRHVLAVGDAETGLRLVGSLVWFWIVRDMEDEAGGWAVEVLRMAGGTPPPGLDEQYALCCITANLVAEMTSETGPTSASLVATLTRAVAAVPESPRHPVLVVVRPALGLLQGDVDGARRSLRAHAEHPDPWARAAVHTFVGRIGIHVGDIEGSAADVARGLAMFREIGDRMGLMMSLGGSMHLALARGDAEEALRLGEEGYRYATEGINSEQAAAMLVQVARARMRLGDLVRARQDLDSALASAVRIGEFADAAGTALTLCELSLEEGDTAAARALAEQAHAWVEPRKRRPAFSQVWRRTYSRLGCLAEEEGDLGSAASWHGRALADLQDDPFVVGPGLAILVDGVAALAIAQGDPTRAAELLGVSHTLNGYRNESSYEFRRTYASATEKLGESAFGTAYGRGRATTRSRILDSAPALVTGPPS